MIRSFPRRRTEGDSEHNGFAGGFQGGRFRNDAPEKGATAAQSRMNATLGRERRQRAQQEEDQGRDKQHRRVIGGAGRERHEMERTASAGRECREVELHLPVASWALRRYNQRLSTGARQHQRPLKTLLSHRALAKHAPNASLGLQANSDIARVLDCVQYISSSSCHAPLRPCSGCQQRCSTRSGRPTAFHGLDVPASGLLFIYLGLLVADPASPSGSWRSACRPTGTSAIRLLFYQHESAPAVSSIRLKHEPFNLLEAVFYAADGQRSYRNSLRGPLTLGVQSGMDADVARFSFTPRCSASQGCCLNPCNS